MKIPDKIYINVHPLGIDYSIVPIPDFGGVEYIRKDALLEWAKKQQRKWEECINESKKFPELEKSWITYSGAKIQTEELIEKLKSM